MNIVPTKLAKNPITGHWRISDLDKKQIGTHADITGISNQEM
jgi:hypothetical protein